MPNSVIDGIQDNEGEKAIVQSLFESFEHAGAIGLLHLGFIFILHDLGSPQGDTELAEAKNHPEPLPWSARGLRRLCGRPFAWSAKVQAQQLESLPLSPRATFLLSLLVMSHDVTIPSSSLSSQNLDLFLLFPLQ